MMSNGLSVIPWIPWVVGTKNEVGQLRIVRSSGPLVHVWAQVSV